MFNHKKVTVPMKEFLKIFKSISALKNLNSTEKIILCFIYQEYENNGEYFVSNTGLSRETSLSIPTIIGALKSLKDKGYVKIQKKIHKDSNNTVGKIIIPSTEAIEENIYKDKEQYIYADYEDIS